jgi:hypothetical protein
MFGFRRKPKPDAAAAGGPVPAGPAVSTKFCTDRFNGKYPHVGVYDCRERKVWVCKPLGGQAIRTAHARLIAGVDNAVSTVFKDRFICFWYYTPRTAPDHILGYPIEADDAHLLVRTDPHWDYDRQRLIPPELTDQIDANLERQARHAERVFQFFADVKLWYPLAMHLVGARAADSQFYVKRIEAAK